MNKKNITIIDYGMGNLFSVRRGFENCGATVSITSDHEKILSSSRVVLPGVGAFGNAMEELQRLGLVEVIKQVALNKIPVLGICLGMQLLLDESEEFGISKGLGLIPGKVVPIPSFTISGEPLKIPHIGWNSIQPVGNSGWMGTILENNRPGESMYFVHSFMAVTLDPVHRIAECNYGGHKISGVIHHKNISGCQFHPEKSGEAGLKILRSFCDV